MTGGPGFTLAVHCALQLAIHQDQSAIEALQRYVRRLANRQFPGPGSRHVVKRTQLALHLRASCADKLLLLRWIIPPSTRLLWIPFEQKENKLNSAGGTIQES